MSVNSHSQVLGNAAGVQCDHMLEWKVAQLYPKVALKVPKAVLV